MDLDHIALNRPFILELPDEVLDAIICATRPVARSHRYGHNFSEVYAMGIALSIVCKRFYRITVPYMYADLVIETSEDNEREPRRKQLHRAFRESPLLWPLCQSLTVVYHKTDIRNLYIATDCITWLTAAKTLLFFGLEDRKAWDLLRLATEQKSGCDSLSLGVHYYNLDLLLVIEILGAFESGFLPNLKTLCLYGVSKYGDQMCQEALREKAGTAPFTRLELCNFLLSPKSLEGLVRWSKRLEEFDLQFTFGDDFATYGLSGDWSLAALQPILSIHRKTLRSLTLYAIGESGLHGFDLSQFEALEKLSISSHITGHQSRRRSEHVEPPDALLAPRLRIFRWDMTLLDQQCSGSLDDFGRKEENWLLNFAHKAIERGCPLRRIEISFTPEQWFHESDVYPWDRMDDIGVKLRPYGIAVSYDPPVVSKEEYFRQLCMAGL